MKTWIKEIVLPLVVVLCALFMVSMVGCSAPAKPLKTTPKVETLPKAKVPVFKKSSRCKLLGKTTTKNVAIRIDRNCLKNGVTTIALVILSKSYVAAADDTAQFIIKTLGYKPTLTLLVRSAYKKLPFMLLMVTEKF